jgi:ribosomal protein L44E
VPEHYTKNTLECTAYCNRCGAFTQHRVDTGRRGPCIPCIKKREADNEVERIRRGLEQEQKAERDKEQGKLF